MHIKEYIVDAEKAYLSSGLMLTAEQPLIIVSLNDMFCIESVSSSLVKE
jgi:hypothetical protein